MAALTATILYPKDERLLELFAPENKELSRSRYHISSDEKNIIFSVEASDATALRAALTTITKVLSVWETTLTHGEQKR